MNRAFFWMPLVLLPVLVLSPNAQAKDDRASFNDRVRTFLSRYCTDCHGSADPKGDRSFVGLDGTIADSNALVDYQDILDQLNLGEMPPPDESQPSESELRHTIEWLSHRIDLYHQTNANARDSTVLRRLNSREYRNTVRDLLHLNMQMFDPTSTFPKDEMVEHLDNVGEALVTSGFLLSRYLAAADQVIERAMGPLREPNPTTWTFQDGFRQQPEIDQVHRKTTNYEHITLYDVIGADKHEGAYGPIDRFRKGVPANGYYEIKFKAEAVNRLHPYDDDFLGTDRSEPLRLGIRPGTQAAGKLHLPQPIEPLLAEVDLSDNPKWYTETVWLDKGFTPRFTFRNGLMDARSLWTKLIKKYPDQFPKNLASGIVSKRFNAIKHGKLPQIHIHEIQIRGPLLKQWPTKSQRALLGDDFAKAAMGKELDRQTLQKHLQRFMSQAFRRSVTNAELDHALNLVSTRRETGRTQLQAYGDALKAVLCSPSFLYLDEGSEDALTPHALASRLSYFIWSSMPDERLRQLAAANTLTDSKTLSMEVERLLADPKSEAMIVGFLDSWITLRNLGSAPPERSSFRDFYHYDLGTAMRTESKLFAKHLIDHNLSIVNFIDSDFTFVNKRLAQLYGFSEGPKTGFRRVRLNDPRRGGLLGQASVLTVSANGIDTSPVVRGVWVLENFLGTPPSPPPPDVEPLDPDTRGAKTIRDQLRKHRETASCNDCHQKIDPLGFALENYDPIGRWRSSYGKKTKIDASGKLPSGEEFADIVELKKLLLDQKKKFARALTEKLLAYAIGRTITANDRPDVDRILSRVKPTEWGVRDLIQQVVQSKAFGSK